MICAASVNVPDGVGGFVEVLAPDALADVATCPRLLVSGAEWHEVSASSALFSMTPEQGSLIAGGILGVWAVAVVFRLLYRALSIDVSTSGESES